MFEFNILNIFFVIFILYKILFFLLRKIVFEIFFCGIKSCVVIFLYGIFFISVFLIILLIIKKFSI